MANPYFSVYADKSMQPLELAQSILIGVSSQFEDLLEKDESGDLSAQLFLMEMNVRTVIDLVQKELG